MTRERWRAVARVEKTHGRWGEVVTVPTHGLPPLMRASLGLAVVPPELKARRTLVVSGCFDGKHGQRVSFEGVRDLGEASALVGKTLLARVADLPRGWELLDCDLPVGLSVVDGRLGELGRVRAIELVGDGRVWVVASGRGETLVPAVPEFVRHLDFTAGVAMVELPVGLAPWDG